MKFELINEIDDVQITHNIIVEELNEIKNFYNDILNESVQNLANKFQDWLDRKMMTPEETAHMIAGIALLVSDEGRQTITKQDLINLGVQGDLHRAEKIDNVDLNQAIRKQITFLGKQKAPKLSSMIIQAIRERNYNQIRQFILKLSLYVDRIKSKETYTKQPMHQVKNNRRTAPNVQDVPTKAQQ